jgi:hypothetical protein
MQGFLLLNCPLPRQGLGQFSAAAAAYFMHENVAFHFD